MNNNKNIINLTDENYKVVVVREKERDDRKSMEYIDSKWFDEKLQLNYVKNLFFSQEFELQDVIKRELTSKLSGYKQQDIKKDKYDITKFITFDQLVELLITSKMKCKYCLKTVFLLYEKQREKVQWTLDRIDNDDGHNNENVIVACLECNLRRRRMDADKFLFTKQLNLVKLGE
jgi:hypothetical protein